MPVLRVAKEKGTRPGSYFYHVQDGFHYHFNQEREGTSYYRCILYSKGCTGFARFDLAEGFECTVEHNHGPDLLYPDEMALRRRILRRCANLDYTSYHQILAQESRRFHPEVSARVTYARMRTPMRNARMQNFPNAPASLRELSRMLLDPQHHVITMTEDGVDNIYAGSVNDVDGGHHVVFVSDRMLERMRNFKALHSDGTFNAVPIRKEFAAQVFCIVGVWRHHIIALSWILMESKTQTAYTAVLQFLRNILGPNIELTRIITDFETAEQNAWAAIFQVTVQGCLWHLAKAFLDQVGALHLINRMRRIYEVKRIIRLTLALPLLPEDLILVAFHLIMVEAQNEGNFIFRILRPYLLFVWRFWVSRPWRRERMSVFGSSQRTNNACECQNKMLRVTVGIHPNIYQFLLGLVQLEQRSHNMVLALEEGRHPGRGRKRSSIMNDRRILQLSEDLFNPPGPINHAIMNFLRRASHTMDNMVDELFHARRRNNDGE